MRALSDTNKNNLKQKTFHWICVFFLFVTTISLGIEFFSLTIGFPFSTNRIIIRSISLTFNAFVVWWVFRKKTKKQLLEHIAAGYVFINFLFSLAILLISSADFAISSLTMIVLSCFFLFSFSFFVSNQLFTSLFGLFLLFSSIVYMQLLKPNIFYNQYSRIVIFNAHSIIVPFGIMMFTVLFSFNRKMTSSIVTEINLYTSTLAKLAYTDQITGVPNALQLAQDIQNFEQSMKNDNFTCIMVGFHLDGLETINETRGIEFANKVLKTLATKFQENLLGGEGKKYGFDILPEFKPLYRVESNTFVSLLTITDRTLFDPQKRSILKETMEQVISQFSERIVLLFRGGFSSYPDDAHTLNQLLRNILNLVHSKQNDNISTFVPFDREMYKLYVRRDSIKNAIAPAIKRDEFRLVFQPKIIVSDGSLFGFEALARWTNPEYGVISPGEFIPLVEGSGLINKLTSFILDTVFNFIGELQKLDLVYPISINLSPETISTEYIQILVSKIERSGLGSLIEFEITESIVMKMTTEISSTFRKLKNLGITFSIDDFGTGYSNLGYLQDFDAEILKIDKSFIDGIPYNENTKKLVKTIIQMGKTFGMYIVAEGVETQEQRDFLAEHECDIIQGYFYSKPLEPTDAINFLKTTVSKNL